MDEMIARHEKACGGFSAVVQQADGSWENPSPCTEWDARGVVEHVIGFHDVLLLRPLDAKPDRPKGDPVARWALTVSAISSALRGAVGGKEMATPAPSDADLSRLLPVLTTDVLVHTWDLARAVGVDPQLDPELCAISYAVVQPNDERLRASDMFGPAVPVSADADPATRLVAFLGRDPGWTA
jgi:uncharacterized protein (TIGR03086 family)